jgi:beta-glucosidase
VDNNAGDRTNLTLWNSSEALITATAAVCSNTIVVQHVVGPVLVESWIDHPNVTAVLHAGLPGKESGCDRGRSVWRREPPRLPYTIARARTDY